MVRLQQSRSRLGTQGVPSMTAMRPVLCSLNGGAGLAVSGGSGRAGLLRLGWRGGRARGRIPS